MKHRICGSKLKWKRNQGYWRCPKCKKDLAVGDELELMRDSSIVTKYLIIEKLPERKNRKTNHYHITSKKRDILLGSIKWYFPWRQYCFFPEGGTVWNDGCLQDIYKFLVELKG